MLSPEAFPDQVKAALIAGLPDALAGQTAAWAAADEAGGRKIELVAPREGDYYIGGVPAVIRYPTIEIAVPDLTMSEFSLGNTDVDVRPVLMVRALFQLARSPEELYRMGCRWFAAVLTVLLDRDTFPELAAQTVRGAWRFNPETNDLDEVQSGVLITFGMDGPLSPFGA